MFAWDAAAMGEAPAEAVPAIRAVAEALELAVARTGAWALRREGGARRLHADTSNDMLVVEDGKSSGPRRTEAAEAGATVTDVDGHPWTLESDSLLIAADAALHAKLLALR
jgi:hypothetical protein